MTSAYKKTSKGFVLLPIILMLLLAATILLTLSQQMTSHILLEKEVAQYLEAQNLLPQVINSLETQLSLLAPTTPTPLAQEDLLNSLNTWPSETIDTKQIHTYSQLIHNNDKALIYSSLIAIGDNHTDQRLLYELISTCTLAVHTCHPVQSSSMNITTAHS